MAFGYGYDLKAIEVIPGCSPLTAIAYVMSAIYLVPTVKGFSL